MGTVYNFIEKVYAFGRAAGRLGRTWYRGVQ